MNIFKKKPYLVKLFCTQDDIKKIDDFFSEENADLFPSYVQDCLDNCDVFEESDFHFIIIIDELSMDFIKDTLTNILNIKFDIKDATKQLLLGDYPFELSVGKRKAIEDIVLDNINVDDVLEKISIKGMQSLSDREKLMLKHYEL